MRRGFRVFSAVAALAGLLGCVDEGESGGSEALYIGVVDGTQTRLAIVRTADALEAYVCGQGPTLELHTRWFSGALDASDASATALTKDDWQLRVFADPASMSGELIAPDGRALAWSAARASLEPESEVGLYESFETGCRSGVIVWEAAPGDGCSAQGAWCDASGVRGQVTPAECTAGGRLRVRGERDGEWFEMVAERVHGP